LDSTQRDQIDAIFKPVAERFDSAGKITECNTAVIYGYQIRVDKFDPSGTISDASNGVAIQGAKVTLYGLNETTGAYSLVTNPALFTPAINPEYTDSAGGYGWDVVRGKYFVNVQAYGYFPANSSIVSVPPPATNVNVKLTPVPKPNTSLVVSEGILGDNNWYKSPSINVTLKSQDGSGIDSIRYVVDNQSQTVIVGGGAKSLSTSFTESSPGVHNITFWSVGSDGFVERSKSQILRIDSTPPIITINVPNTANSGVIPFIAASDNVSGIFLASATLDGNPYEIGTQINAIGPHTLSVTAKDRAGNNAGKTVSFEIDYVTTTTTTSTSSTQPLAVPEFSWASGPPVVALSLLILLVALRYRMRRFHHQSISGHPS
jgi:hypothetical protein